MKLILVLPAAGLVCSGMLNFSKPVATSPSSQPMLPATTPVTTTMPMRASSSVVYKGESIHLQFTTPHAGYLGIIDPDGKFFYVVFPASCATGKLQPLVDSESFCGLSSLSLPTGTLKADPYTYGVYENQPVFTKSGTYRIILGDNLSVDREDGLSIVKIRYKHTPRPGTA
jgi:hypothetical protein